MLPVKFSFIFLLDVEAVPVSGIGVVDEQFGLDPVDTGVSETYSHVKHLPESDCFSNCNCMSTQHPKPC